MSYEDNVNPLQFEGLHDTYSHHDWDHAPGGGMYFYHGTNQKFKYGQILRPGVANPTDYDLDENDQPTVPHPHTYLTTRANTAARYGRNVYRVQVQGYSHGIKEDTTMIPQAEAYKTDFHVRAVKKYPYRPPQEEVDKGSMRNDEHPVFRRDDY